ncbi:MAG: ATP-binding protein [Candidatus Buchananbacteria bacterium]
MFFENLIGSKSNFLVGLIIAILVVVGFQPLRKVIEKTTERFLFKTSYDPDVLLSRISEVTATILDVKQLMQSISEILDESLHFSKISFALLSRDGKLFISYEQGFEVKTIIDFASGKEKILPLYFKNNRDVQVIDELETKYEAGEYIPKNIDLLNGLRSLDVALVVPLYVKERLIGIIVIGNKKSGDPYSHQDLNVLKIIAGQAAIAIENATLYDELKDYNIKLDEEVKKKTTELRKANDELKQLDEAKSEFISIASHQLRTPLTIIKGYISMMQEGSFGKLSPVIDANLSKVYQANERLIKLVENLLDISRIESGRQDFKMTKIHLEEMAQVVVDNLKGNAKEKKLKLIFHKPTHATPEVMADEGKIHEVMMNFVDNSIKYTKEGKVEVFVTLENGLVTFCVKDTGMGIKPEVMTVLFQKFSRGEGSFRAHTEGLGLGLYVARMMIDAHKGKIWAESDGENKGSKFCFSLPVAK